MPILGTGFAPSLFALTLLALPPILINTYTAIRQVDAGRRRRGARHGDDAQRDRAQGRAAARAAGDLRGHPHGGGAGVSGAVLAAYIGGGGLGDFITAGIAMMALPQLLVGAIPATLLALGTDRLFGRAAARADARAACARA